MNWLLREAIPQHVTREEQRESFRREALDVWRDYQETGLRVTGDEVDAWFQEIEADGDVEPPKCQG